MRLFNICSIPGNKLCSLIEYKPIIKPFTCFKFFATTNKFCRDVLELLRSHATHYGKKAEVNIFMSSLRYVITA